MTAMVTALFDANVLFGARLRSLLMELAVSGLFRAHWSADIHREWMSAVSRRAGIAVERLETTKSAMDEAVPDALVEGYDSLISMLSLPDPDDRHVIAAAIKCQASVIVTFNEQDFPKDILAAHGLQTRHPDRFILDIAAADSAALLIAARRDIAHYENPRLSVEDYIGGLRRAGLPSLATYLLDNLRAKK